MKMLWLCCVVTTAHLMAGEIKIAVAANVSYAIDTLITAFEKHHPHTQVRVTLGSSGKLTAQIQNGAPYGLLMSANMAYPEALYISKDAITAPVVYAQGALAYLSATPKALVEGMALVNDPMIRKITIANPKTAPYGKAAVEAMQRAGVYDHARSKLVYAESISQSVAYTLHAVDLGFVAKSSLYSDKMTAFKEGIHWAAVDGSLYAPIEQGMVLLKRADKNPEYRAFYDFMLSSQARDILVRYGYVVP